VWRISAQSLITLLDTRLCGSYEAASLRLLKRGGELVSVGSSGPGRDGVGLAGLVGMLLNAAVRSTLGRLGLGPWYRL
jgi:hypothetical protein